MLTDGNQEDIWLLIRYSTFAGAVERDISCALRTSPQKLAHIRSVVPNQTRRVLDSSMVDFLLALIAMMHLFEHVGECPRFCAVGEK